MSELSRLALAWLRAERHAFFQTGDREAEAVPAADRLCLMISSGEAAHIGNIYERSRDRWVARWEARWRSGEEA